MIGAERNTFGLCGNDGNQGLVMLSKSEASVFLSADYENQILRLRLRMTSCLCPVRRSL
jgi:hypothetical protein